MGHRTTKLLILFVAVGIAALAVPRAVWAFVSPVPPGGYDFNIIASGADDSWPYGIFSVGHKIPIQHFAVSPLWQAPFLWSTASPGDMPCTNQIFLNYDLYYQHMEEQPFFVPYNPNADYGALMLTMSNVYATEARFAFYVYFTDQFVFATADGIWTNEPDYSMDNVTYQVFWYDTQHQLVDWTFPRALGTYESHVVKGEEPVGYPWLFDEAKYHRVYVVKNPAPVCTYGRLGDGTCKDAPNDWDSLLFDYAVIKFFNPTTGELINERVAVSGMAVDLNNIVIEGAPPSWFMCELTPATWHGGAAVTPTPQPTSELPPEAIQTPTPGGELGVGSGGGGVKPPRPVATFRPLPTATPMPGQSLPAIVWPLMPLPTVASINMAPSSTPTVPPPPTATPHPSYTPPPTSTPDPVASPTPTPTQTPWVIWPAMPLPTLAPIEAAGNTAEIESAQATRVASTGEMQMQAAYVATRWAEPISQTDSSFELATTEMVSATQETVGWMTYPVRAFRSVSYLMPSTWFFFATVIACFMLVFFTQVVKVTIAIASAVISIIYRLWEAIPFN